VAEDEGERIAAHEAPQLGAHLPPDLEIIRHGDMLHHRPATVAHEASAPEE
jgi:hypothetical protein